MAGKKLTIYLVGGTPTGILAAEIGNWTGKVVVTPRVQLADLASRKESRRTGVYLLVGPDPEQSGKDRVYVGEGDNVLSRLTHHDRDEERDFWTRAAFVISKDDNLTKAHVRYLEARLIQLAREAGRANLDNATTPDPPVLPEADLADVEFFLEQVRMILPILGFNYLQPRPTVSEAQAGDTEGARSPIFVLDEVGAHARGQEIGDEFVVFKGSTTRKQGTPSWSSYKPLREQLIQDGKLSDTDDSDYYVFTENVAFSSPSAAGAIVRAGSTNGRRAWKIEKTGKSYRQWQEARLQDAGLEEPPEAK